MALYVQYGSGSTAIDKWINFDASPTLRLQRLPVIGRLISGRLNCRFETGVRYGNILKGLPVTSGSVKGVFCSHILEHLSLNDCRKALTNTYQLLQPGGRFRCIVPDLKVMVDEYISRLAFPESRCSAAPNFLKKSLLGRTERRRDLKGFVTSWLGNHEHLWMWDEPSLTSMLADAGFIKIKPFIAGQCDDPMFLLPERPHQFECGIGLEGYKSDL